MSLVIAYLVPVVFLIMLIFKCDRISDHLNEIEAKLDALADDD